MAQKITQQQIDNAVFMYQWRRELTTTEIANLNNMSRSRLMVHLRERFKDGSLTPRTKNALIKPKLPKTPNKRGCYDHSKHRKLTAEQEQQLLHDYYELDMTEKQVLAKYKILPRTLPLIRKRYAHIYSGAKKGGRPKKVVAQANTQADS